MTSRRQFLAVAGSAALAGCSALDWGPEPEPPSFAPDALRSVAALPVPETDERLSISIGQEYVDAGVERVESLLEPVPADVGAEDVPNEVVRDHVTRQRDRGEGHLERALESGNRFTAVKRLRVARSYAANANATYAAAHDERTREDVLVERSSLRAELNVLRGNLTYAGDAPVPALVTFAILERYADATERALERAADRPGNADSGAPLVGETADRVEAARAFLGDAEHVRERYAEATDDATDWRGAFERALDALLADVRRRRDALPARDGDPTAQFDRDLGGTPAERLVAEAFRGAVSGVRIAGDGKEDGRLAEALLAVHAADRDLRAFERVRAAVEDGAHGRPEGTGAVRAAKLDALEAVDRARSSPAHPLLTNRSLSAIASGIRAGDRRARDATEYDDSRGAYGAIADYAWAAARADATSAANARIAGLLR